MTTWPVAYFPSSSTPPSCGPKKEEEEEEEGEREREREGKRGRERSKHQVSRRASHPVNAASDSNRRECAHNCWGGGVHMRPPVGLEHSLKYETRINIQYKVESFSFEICQIINPYNYLLLVI